MDLCECKCQNDYGVMFRFIIVLVKKKKMFLLQNMLWVVLMDKGESMRQIVNVTKNIKFNVTQL
jgi:hypothetical protein